ncbi:MAG: type transport system ATP-binding protein [Actinomycetota bacterium]|jgi:ABC-2 type transport system ATP-binding protein|nr:type transport system ATP-binding protein [Actinomycetota bacterium]
MAKPTLDARRLTKRFGTRTAVEELSFAAQEGDVVGLLGPNGAGKTTTIRLLTTILTPTSGEFSVAGFPATRPDDIRRRVGVLPESAGYPGHQTGREYLRYHARLFGLGRPEAEREADRLLAQVGLADRGSTRISTYSRGMRQRLGIARALVNDPAVVFLDEPTLGLDPAGQRQILGIVREIAQRSGATVVLSTHTLPEVEAICTTVLILDRGRVIADGTISEITRTVGVQRSGRLRVPVDMVERASEALAAVEGLTLEPGNGRGDVLTFALSDRNYDRAETGMNAALRAALRADIPVLSFELEGVRLSDAFLTLTSERAG